MIYKKTKIFFLLQKSKKARFNEYNKVKVFINYCFIVFYIVM